MLKKIMSFVLLLALIFGISIIPNTAEASSLSGSQMGELIIEDNIVTPDSYIWSPSGEMIVLRIIPNPNSPQIGDPLPHGTRLNITQTNGSGSNMWLFAEVLGTTQKGWVQAKYVL